MLTLFTLCIFLSAFLVFLLQPMIGKIFLPWVGGAPAAWNTCMFFFQLLLLGGYFYAHASLSKLKIRFQTILHLALMIIAALTLPVVFYGSEQIPDYPSLWLLQQLFITTALPFFTVSATAPLLQKWFFYTTHTRAGNPFFLYAASNAGSLSALVAYPFLIEPELNLIDQANLWKWGFYLLIALMAGCALCVKPDKAEESDSKKEIASKLPADKIKAWLMASFLPSALLLAVTHHITRGLAPIPMLWIAPLIIYLLTFIIAFAERFDFIKSRIINRYAVLLVAVFLPAYFVGEMMGFALNLSLHLGMLFIASLMCHKYLADTRPEATQLTEFYLWLSVGGLLGGLFNTFIAPALFTNLDEYPILVFICATFLRYAADENDNETKSFTAQVSFRALASGVVMLLFIFEFSLSRLLAYFADSYGAGLRGGVFAPLLSYFSWQEILLKLLLCIALIVILRMAKRLKSLDPAAFTVIAIMLFFFIRMDKEGTVIYRSRNFFGIKEIIRLAEDNLHQITQGNTIHGMQIMKDSLRREPLTYYHRQGPLGDIFSLPFTTSPDLQVGIIGLGAGSMMAYARPGQHFDFYEIDPAIVEVALDPQFFTFLHDSPGSYSIKIGDGRLKLAEAENQKYDLIILDAFSSGFVPVHLLTVEAFEIYLSKLKPDGLIVMNISSRYLNITALVAAIAKELDLLCLGVGDYFFDDEADEHYMHFASDYALVSRSKVNIPEKGINARLGWVKVSPVTGAKAWTDSFSSIIPLLNF